MLQQTWFGVSLIIDDVLALFVKTIHHQVVVKLDADRLSMTPN